MPIRSKKYLLVWRICTKYKNFVHIFFYDLEMPVVKLNLLQILFCLAYEIYIEKT
jgi:hypothetical protein